jgi:ABC-type nickel/cobalt efflux system permease component RcnA
MRSFFSKKREHHTQKAALRLTHSTMRIVVATQWACGLPIILLATSLTATSTTRAMSTAATAAVVVPARMMLSQSMRDSIQSLPGLYHAPLAKIDLAKDAVTGDVVVTEEATNLTTLGSVPIAHPSVCFVVRRPG